LKPSTEKESTEGFAYTPSFGEGLPGKKTPVIFLFDWEKSKLTALSFKNPSILFGQPVFSPTGNDIIYATGYEYTHEGKLLGVKFCFNHPFGLWEIKLPTSDSAGTQSNSDEDDKASTRTIQCQLRKLTPPDLSCRSPRILVTEKSTQLLWISNATGGAHAGTAAIHSLDITSKVDPADTRVVVDRVWTPKDGEFPGLYCDPTFVQSPYLRLDGKSQNHLVLHTTWGSTTRVVLVSLRDGSVKDLTKDSGDDLLTWSVLNTDGGRRVLCSRSSITKPYELVVGEVEDSGAVSWKVVYATSVSSKSARFFYSDFSVS
jgi:acylaminoacyl-peptidase